MKKGIDIKQIIKDSQFNMDLIFWGNVAYCPVCKEKMLNAYLYDGKIRWDSPTQKAHLISNSKAMLKKHGREIIDNPINWALVCSLECNNAIQVKNNPEMEKYILELIDMEE